jgi:1,4-dihydroxy-2-naphthoyl-CoA hydrolase
MADHNQMTINLQDLMPFARACGIRILTATSAEVRGEMHWAPELCTAAGVMHGGALITFADTLGAMCAVFNLPSGATTTTIESKTNFFRPLRSGSAHAVSVPLHVGRNTVVVQTDVRDSENRRIALVTQTQAVLAARS